MNITREIAETMGRTAAHVGMTQAQLNAMFVALGHSATSTIARLAEAERLRRLAWVASGAEY